MKSTVIIGASTNPDRYAYKAAQMLNQKGYDFFLIGNKKGELLNKTILPFGTPLKDIDTITLYLNPTAQKEYYDYFFSLQPKRIIFNPGTENQELANFAAHKGIETINACTLVLLSTNQF